ncbi:MAG: SMC family ATPase [Candidatus Woesearchaeota archaeon]
MILKSLKLQNIRSYVDEFIEFPLNSTLIKGDIGSGKSTILYAIEFALFGLVNDLTYQKLLRVGTSEGKIVLHFIHNGKEVVIERTIIRKNKNYEQKNVKIVVNNNETYLSPVEAKYFIFKLLNYPLEFLKKDYLPLFRFTIYTPQESMKEILRSKSDERLSVIRKVFSIDKYEIMRENLRKIILPYLRSVLKGITESTKKLPELKEKVANNSLKIEEYQRKLNSLLSEQIILKEKIQSISKELEKTLDEETKFLKMKIEKDNLLEKQRTIEKEILELEEKLSISENKRSKIEDEINKLKLLNENLHIEKSKELLLKDIEEKEKFLEEKKNQIFETEKYIKEIEVKQEYLEKRLSEEPIINEELIKLNSQLENVSELETTHKKEEMELESLQNRLNEIKDLFFQSKNRINEKEKVIENIENLQTCPLCLQRIDPTHKSKIKSEFNDFINSENEKLKKLEFEKNEIENEIERKRKNINNLIQRINQSKILLAKKEQLEKQILEIKEIKNEIQKNSSLLEKYKKILQVLKMTDFDGIKQEILLSRKELEKIQEKEKIEIRLQELSEHLKYLLNEMELSKKKIEAYKKDKENIISQIEVLEKLNIEETLNQVQQTKSNLKNSKLEFEEKESKVISEIAELRGRIKNLFELNRDIINEINRLEKEKEKYELLENLLRYFETFFMPLTENIETHIRLQILKDFDELYRKWFDKLIDNELLISRLDEDFSVVVEQNGYNIDFEDLSGGEKTACSLAYRLALNETILNYFGIKENIIILDEPTDGFSKEQLEKVRDILKELMFSQVIIVSHEQDIESFVDNIIYVEKSNGISRIKK